MTGGVEEFEVIPIFNPVGVVVAAPNPATEVGFAEEGRFTALGVEVIRGAEEGASEADEAAGELACGFNANAAAAANRLSSKASGELPDAAATMLARLPMLNSDAETTWTKKNESRH
jgi:nitrous oxide reductase